MRNRPLTILFILFLVFLPLGRVSAQDQPKGPVYVVQPGDTLNLIAIRFGVSVDELMNSNAISDPNLLAQGQELVIPGLEGVQGKLITEVTQLGDNLISLSRRFMIPEPMLIKLNHVTSPAEVYAGANLIIPQNDQQKLLSSLALIASGQSLLEAAVINDTNPWDLASNNQLEGSWNALPGSALYFSGKDDQSESSPIPLVSKLSMNPLPLVQGNTETIHITAVKSLQLSGSLAGQELHFFPTELGKTDYVALQGVYALTKPGLVPFVLRGTSENGQSFEFQQMVLVEAGGYVKDPPLFVDPETIDPANTKPEDDKVKQTTTPATPDRYWNGMFRPPVDEPICIKSWYGNRRSYNGGDYIYFHTGVDYGVCANLNIYAPAAGVVVFTGPLTVRGNATIIDHGWGVYSGIYHQAEIKVKVGDRVEAGQLIGVIGATGRVTGPHLHWDVFVNGIQVQPLDWLDRSFP
jgi:murein DD-endopeptidase MepM/ murein hydrolase activator NlpD